MHRLLILVFLSLEFSFAGTSQDQTQYSNVEVQDGQAVTAPESNSWYLFPSVGMNAYKYDVEDRFSKDKSDSYYSPAFSVELSKKVFERLWPSMGLTYFKAGGEYRDRGMPTLIYKDEYLGIPLALRVDTIKTKDQQLAVFLKGVLTHAYRLSSKVEYNGREQTFQGEVDDMIRNYILFGSIGAGIRTQFTESTYFELTGLFTRSLNDLDRQKTFSANSQGLGIAIALGIPL